MYDNWEDLEQACLVCRQCGLCQERRHVVFGVGNPKAKVLFVGEGPGEHEDLKGEPIVGRGGQLLDKLLAAIDLDRKSNIYIANIVKCRPPGNRDPQEDEKAACLNYLRYQLMLIQPKIIVCLGRIAATTVIDPGFKITRQRGQWFERKGYHMIATYHPSALLRDETKKRPAWEDMQAIRQKWDELKG